MSDVIEFKRCTKSLWFHRWVRNICWVLTPLLMYYWYTLKMDVLATRGQRDEVFWTFLILPCIALFFSWLMWLIRHQTFRITNTGVQQELGWLCKRSTTLPFGRIRQVEFEESWVGHLRGYGTISLDSTGDSSGDIHLYNVADPALRIKQIEERIS